MKHVKLYEEIEFNKEWTEEDEKDLKKRIIKSIDDMFEGEHRTQELKIFFKNLKERLLLLSYEDRKEIEKYLDDNHKKIKIKKFPNEDPYTFLWHGI